MRIKAKEKTDALSKKQLENTQTILELTKHFTKQGDDGIVSILASSLEKQGLDSTVYIESAKQTGMARKLQQMAEMGLLNLPGLTADPNQKELRRPVPHAEDQLSLPPMGSIGASAGAGFTKYRPSVTPEGQEVMIPTPEQPMPLGTVSMEDGQAEPNARRQVAPMKMTKINISSEGDISAELAPNEASIFADELMVQMKTNKALYPDEMGKAEKLAFRGTIEKTGIIPSNIGELVKLYLPSDEDKEAAYWKEVEAIQGKITQQYTKAGKEPAFAEIAAMKLVEDTMGYAPKEAKAITRPQQLATDQDIKNELSRMMDPRHIQYASTDAINQAAYNLQAHKLEEEQDKRTKILRPLPEDTAEDLKALTDVYAPMMDEILTKMQQYKEAGVPFVTGPWEFANEPLDAWGPKFTRNADRIKLRSDLVQLMKVLYNVAGKQLALGEMTTMRKMFPQMNRQPEAFEIETKKFLQYVDRTLMSKYTGLEDAGFDVTKFKPGLEKYKTLYSKWSGEGGSKKAKAQPTYKPDVLYSNGKTFAVFQGYGIDGAPTWQTMNKDQAAQAVKQGRIKDAKGYLKGK
jgi:hypothetical protein